MSDEKSSQKQYRVKLMQTVPEHEVVAEEYTELDGKPFTNPTDAKTAVQDFLDDQKDMKGVTYRLETEEITEPERHPFEPEPAPEPGSTE